MSSNMFFSVIENAGVDLSRQFLVSTVLIGQYYNVTFAILEVYLLGSVVLNPMFGILLEERDT